MSGQSQLHKKVKNLFALVLIFWTHSAFGGMGIEADRSDESKHGLFEVREEAKKFIARENTKNHTNFVVLEPNLKSQVPRCAVPLKSEWAPKRHGLSGMNVFVICTKTVDKNDKKWKLNVPAYDPAKVHKGK